MGVASQIALLFLLPAITVSQRCTSNDFGIAYDGVKVFTVSSVNNTCSCLNYASSGVASFSNATVGTLAVNSIVAGPSLGSSLLVTGNAVLSGGAQIPAGSTLDLGLNAAGRDSDAGKIVYRSAANDTTLSIVGAGASGAARQVTVFDVLKVGTNVAVGGVFQCTGLPGAYYQNTALSGAPLCSKTDAVPFLSWGNVGPCNVCGGALACTGWSVRWSGYLRAPVTGLVTLSITCDDGIRVWLNNMPDPVVDSWTSQSGATYQAFVDMTAGAYVPIRIEYFQNTGAFQFLMQWYWTGPGGGLAQVPASNLCSAIGVQATGTSSFTGQTSFNGPVLFTTGIGSQSTPTTVNSPLVVSGSTLMAAPLNVNASATASSLAVSGPTTLSGATSVASLLTATGGVGASSLSVSGGSLFAGQVTATGGIQASALNVTGITTIGGQLRANGGLVASTIAASGLISANLGLTVTGPVAMSSGTVSISGATTLSGGASVSNGLSTNTLAVSGTSSFSGQVSAAGISASTVSAANLVATSSLQIGQYVFYESNGVLYLYRNGQSGIVMAIDGTTGGNDRFLVYRDANGARPYFYINRGGNYGWY